MRFLLLYSRCTKATLLLYLCLGSPALLIELWFEKIGRPSAIPNTGELKRPGEDLEAKGLTEYLWDVLYWTWGTILVAALVGNRAWWMWLATPVYSAWLGWTTYGGMKKGMGGMMGQKSEGESGSESKRQKKLEKRGGQKMQYR